MRYHMGIGGFRKEKLIESYTFLEWNFLYVWIHMQQKKLG